MSLKRWRGSVALVTGASSGIGAATARHLAEAGMRVAACARRKDRLAALRDAGDVLPLPCDLREESQILEMFDRVDAEWGGVDVLVNNAGLGYAEPLSSGDTERWREMLEVNVLALSVCTREFLQRLAARDQRHGHVVHISSMSAHRVPGGSGMYSATKFAVRSLTEGLRKELRAAGSPVRITSISPGFVETEFAANYHDDPDAEAAGGQIRVLDDTDIAEMVGWVLGAPEHAEVHDILVRPTAQSS